MSAVIDLAKKRNRIVLVLDIFLGTLFFGECWPTEPMSSYFWRTDKKGWIRFINWLFRSPIHCWAAYVSEQEGTQNAPEYQNGKGA